MRRIRRALVALAAVGIFGGGGIAAAMPAQAAAHGCPYPYVCFYPTINQWNAGTPVSRYQDVTEGWQWLRSQSTGAEYVYNTRHDDVAYLHFAFDSSTYCLAPGQYVFLFERYVDAIRISTEDRCPS